MPLKKRFIPNNNDNNNNKCSEAEFEKGMELCIGHVIVHIIMKYY